MTDTTKQEVEVKTPEVASKPVETNTTEVTSKPIEVKKETVQSNEIIEKIKVGGNIFIKNAFKFISNQVDKGVDALMKTKPIAEKNLKDSKKVTKKD